MNFDSHHPQRQRDSSKSRDEGLDRLLVNWAANRSSSLDSGDQLLARIISQIADGSPVAERTSAEPSEGELPRSSTWLFMGIAAVVLVIVTLSIRRSVDDRQLAKQDPPSVASPAQPSKPGVGTERTFVHVPAADTPEKALSLMPATDAAEKAMLFDELEQMFVGKLCWVAETGNDVRLGMCEGGTLADKQYPAVSVRLTVVRRSAGDKHWLPVWSMDVMTRNERIVHTGSGDTEIAFWVHRMPDGMLAVDADVTLTGPVELQTSYSGIQQFGVPSEIYTATIDSAEYAVFQTIVSLDPDDDVS